MRAFLVLVFAACAGSEGDTASSLATCELDPTTACAAPVQPVVASEGTPIAAGVSYEVSGVGALSFTASVTGTHTIYFDSEPHVCDVHVLAPTCASSVACPMFGDARQYAMVAGEDYEIRVPDGAHVRVDAPTTMMPGPTITWTSGPADGATTGPVVAISFEVTSYASLDCRLDGTPGACPLLLGEFQHTSTGPHTFEVRAIDAAGNISVATKTWTTVCNPPSTQGALALLHLDDVTNSVPGGPDATATGVTFDGNGRFGGAAVFSSGDTLTWPLQLGTRAQWAVEMWLRPQAIPGDVLVTGDGSLTIRTIEDAGTRRFAVTVLGEEVRASSFTPGTWHKLLASYDGEALRVWTDNAMYYRPGLFEVTLDDVVVGGVGTVDELWISGDPIVEYESGLDRYCRP
jgi:hypothetical protein